MTPYVGQTVHYVAHGTPVRPDGTQVYTATCRAALITELGDDHRHGLMVANPTGQFFNTGVPADRGHLPSETSNPTGAPCPQTGRLHTGGTWHHITDPDTVELMTAESHTPVAARRMPRGIQATGLKWEDLADTVDAIRRFAHPDYLADDAHEACGYLWQRHGILDLGSVFIILCPGMRFRADPDGPNYLGII